MGLTKVRDTVLRDKSRGLSPGKSVPGVPSTARVGKAGHNALKAGPAEPCWPWGCLRLPPVKTQGCGENNQYRTPMTAVLRM